MRKALAWTSLFAFAMTAGACGDDDPAVTIDAPPGDPADAGPGDPDAEVPPMPDGGVTPGPVETCDPAEIVECVPQDGAPGADGVIVRGTIVNAGELLCSGDVLYSKASGTILCVAEDCTAEAGAAGAAIVCADLVTPGLIDGHNHMQYNHLPRLEHDGILYDDRGDWQSSSEYQEFRDANDDIIAAQRCEIMKWAEVRQILAGTTSVVGSSGGNCINVLERNLDEAADANGLMYAGADYVTFISSADTVALRESLMSGVPAFIHIGEGVNTTSRTTEWNELSAEGLVIDGVTVIHGTALSATQFGEMGINYVDLMWSPRSNIDLYGLTTPVTTAKHSGVPVGIGTDWTPSGGMHLLEELHCADHVNRTYYDATFTDVELFAAVTTVPAGALVLEDKIGRLAPGMVADISLFRGNREAPYRAVLEADNDEVILTIIGGNAIYGDAAVMGQVGELNDFCEDLDVCGRARRVCVQTAATTSADKFHQSLTDIEASLLAALGTARTASGCAGADCYMYDLMPLFQCDPPDPTVVCQMGTATIPGVPSAGDGDGDGEGDGADNCPTIFNPPFAGGAAQEDTDGDGEGDACDVCPLTEDTVCPLPDPTDLDGDGFLNADDNCPRAPNDQTDSDSDDRGDLCDACPLDNDPLCMTIGALRDATDPAHPAQGATVRLTGMSVTAIKSLGATARGFWIQQPGATEMGGVFVFYGSTALPTVEVGNVVTVQGTYTEYFGASELTMPMTTVTDASAAPLAPIVVTPGAVDTGGPMAEALEGMLVTVEDVTVTNANPDAPMSFDEFEVDMLRVDDYIYDGGSNNGAPAYMVGTTFSSVTGILHWSFANSKILPRGAADLVP